MQNKKDYITGVVAALVTVVFLWPTLKNINVGGGRVVYLLFAVVPLCWIFGLWFGRFMSRFLGFMYQFAKFVVVGFLNTAIDFGVLNLLSITTGLTSGILLGGVNVPGFTLAAINSYFWNKYWVFKKKEPGEQKNIYKEILSFAIVIIIGAVLNGGVVVLLTTYVSPLGGMTAERWLNIAKVGATVISLVWNFVGFKLIVFRSKSEPEAVHKKMCNL